MKDKDFCAKWMNKWPVLFLTLKDINGIKFDLAYVKLEQTITKLCIEHEYLEMSPNVNEIDKQAFSRLKERKADITEIQLNAEKEKTIF